MATRDRQIFAVLRLLGDAKVAKIARNAKVSATTIRNWRKPISQGGTKYPQMRTLSAVAAACGYGFQLMPLVDIGDRRRAVAIENRLN